MAFGAQPFVSTAAAGECGGLAFPDVEFIDRDFALGRVSSGVMGTLILVLLMRNSARGFIPAGTL